MANPFDELAKAISFLGHAVPLIFGPGPDADRQRINWPKPKIFDGKDPKDIPTRASDQINTKAGDGADSAHRTGLLAFCGSTLDQHLLPQFVLDGGLLVRHPTQAEQHNNDPNHCTRDQLIPFAAGCWRAKRPDLVAPILAAITARGPLFQNTIDGDGNSTIPDPLLPHDIMFLRICAGEMLAECDLIGQVLLQLSIVGLDIGDDDPEINSAVCQAIVCLQLTALVDKFPDYPERIRRWWSAPGRDTPAIGEALIRLIDDELIRYTDQALFPLFPIPAHLLHRVTQEIQTLARQSAELLQGKGWEKYLPWRFDSEQRLFRLSSDLVRAAGEDLVAVGGSLLQNAVSIARLFDPRQSGQGASLPNLQNIGSLLALGFGLRTSSNDTAILAKLDEILRFLQCGLPIAIKKSLQDHDLAVMVARLYFLTDAMQQLEKGKRLKGINQITAAMTEIAVIVRQVDQAYWVVQTKWLGSLCLRTVLPVAKGIREYGTDDQREEARRAVRILAGVFVDTETEFKKRIDQLIGGFRKPTRQEISQALDLIDGDTPAVSVWYGVISLGMTPQGERRVKVLGQEVSAWSFATTYAGEWTGSNFGSKFDLECRITGVSLPKPITREIVSVVPEVAEKVASGQIVLWPKDPPFESALLSWRPFATSSEIGSGQGQTSEPNCRDRMRSSILEITRVGRVGRMIWLWEQRQKEAYDISEALKAMAEDLEFD